MFDLGFQVLQPCAYPGHAWFKFLLVNQTVGITIDQTRETAAQLRKWADEGVLAVDMQAASLFAFGKACNANVAVVAMVRNAVDHSGDQFNTGTEQDGYRILEAIAGAAASFLETEETR